MIFKIPNDIIVQHIASSLDLTQISRLFQTCKHFANLSSNEKIWLILYQQKYTGEQIRIRMLRKEDFTSPLSLSLAQFVFPPHLPHQIKFYQFELQIGIFSSGIVSRMNSINAKLMVDSILIQELTKYIVKMKHIFLLPVYENCRLTFKKILENYIQTVPELACLKEDYETLFGKFTL